jgi:hypothetical protein
MRRLPPHRPAACVVYAALLLVWPALGAPASAADKALQWKFKEGETLRVRIHTRIETQLGAAPPKRAQRDPAPSLDVTLLWKVTQVSDTGAAEIRQTIEHVHEEANDHAPDGPRLVYDSSDPKTVNNPWSALKQELYAPLLGGATYHLTIDRRGDVRAIELPRDVLKGWKSFSLEPSESRDYLFTKPGLEALLSLVPRLPGESEPRAEGAGWRSERQTTARRLQTTRVETYAPSGRQGAMLVFEARPEIALKFIREAPESPEPPVRAAVRTIYPTDVAVAEQSGTSRLVFDPAAGRPASFSRRQRYTVKYTFADRPEAQGREIRETIVRESGGTIELEANGR